MNNAQIEIIAKFLKKVYTTYKKTPMETMMIYVENAINVIGENAKIVKIHEYIRKEVLKK